MTRMRGSKEMDIKEQKITSKISQREGRSCYCHVFFLYDVLEHALHQTGAELCRRQHEIQEKQVSAVAKDTKEI